MHASTRRRGGRRSWRPPPRCSGAATRPACASRRWPGGGRVPLARVRLLRRPGRAHRRRLPPQPRRPRRRAVRRCSSTCRSTRAGWGPWSATTSSWPTHNAASWRLFAAAGAIDHPAVQEARDARCQRIADTWGGGPAERLLARGLVGLLEAAATEWLEQRPCSLDEAAERSDPARCGTGWVAWRRSCRRLTCSIGPSAGILPSCLEPCGAAPSASGWSTSRSSCSHAVSRKSVQLQPDRHPHR